MKTHLMSKSKFARIYYSIRNRCNNEGHSNYSYYGGRGIKCEWNSFESFKNDMYSSYLEHKSKHGVKNTTIDRIDNNKNYYKENCRWVTKIEQGANKRNNNIISFKGKKLTLSQWARELGVSREIIKGRKDAGWKTSDILLLPKKKNQYV